MGVRGRVVAGLAVVVIVVVAVVMATGGSDGDPKEGSGSQATSPVVGDDGGSGGGAAAGREGDAPEEPPAAAEAPRAGGGFDPAPGSQEEKVSVAVDDFYDALAVADRDRGKHVFAKTDKAIGDMTSAICGMMSAAALKQIQDTSPTLDPDPVVACQQSLGLHFGRAAKRGELGRSAKARVLAVERKGAHAEVTLKFPGWAPRPVRMVREKGTWKFDAVPTASGDT
jgi:hypothetical protein